MCVLRDDKAVECSCGCIVYSGWVHEETITVMYRGKPKTVIYTHCGDENCACRTLREKIDSYIDVEEHHIQTAYDKECERSDESRDY